MTKNWLRAVKITVGFPLLYFGLFGWDGVVVPVWSYALSCLVGAYLLYSGCRKVTPSPS